MIIYKYELINYRNFTIEKFELECKETSKIYTLVSRMGFKSRIPKEEIGIVSDWAGKYVLLLEDDFEKSKAIFLDYYSREIESENVRHRSRIEDYQRLIKKIKECRE